MKSDACSGMNTRITALENAGGGPEVVFETDYILQNEDAGFTIDPGKNAFYACRTNFDYVGMYNSIKNATMAKFEIFSNPIIENVDFTFLWNNSTQLRYDNINIKYNPIYFLLVRLGNGENKDIDDDLIFTVLNDNGTNNYAKESFKYFKVSLSQYTPFSIGVSGYYPDPYISTPSGTAYIKIKITKIF